MRKKLILFAALLLVLLLLSGCLPNEKERTTQAGFLQGVWHGWLAPISLVGEAAGLGTHLFETNTTGFSYDLGFYMAVISGFGGLALCRRKRRRKNKD